MRSALLLLLLWPAVGWGQKVTLPKEVPGEPGAFVRVQADTDCGSLQWHALDPGLNLFPVELLKDTKTAVVTASRPGRYRLLAYGAKGDTASPPAVTVVVIGDAPPGPTPPDPTPGPIDDPLVKALQAAYDKETATDRAELKGKLAALYRSAAEVTGNATLATWGDLFAVVAAAAQSLGVSGKLPTLQAAVRDGALEKLPTERQRPLDADGRKVAAEAFRRAATALEGVK
jgi:hypothetical protein